MRRDQQPGLLVRVRHRPQHPFDAGGDALRVRGALEDAGSDARAGDPVAGVGDEQLVELVDAAPEGTAPVVEVVGELVVGVEAGGHHDVDVHLVGHPFHELDVTAEPDDGEVDDGADARLVEFPQPFDGLRDAGLGIPPGGPVLLDLRRQDEDVLVHERGPELLGVDRPASGHDGGHGDQLPPGAGALDGEPQQDPALFLHGTAVVVPVGCSPPTFR